MQAQEDIKEFSLQQLKEILAKKNFPPFRASQVFLWIYKKGALSFSAMNNLPLDLRDFLAGSFSVCSSEIKEVLISKDGTRKFAIELKDANVIEAVFIPGPGRNTLCISSQVGCRFGCTFCASSPCAWQRNLSCGEILDQILLAKDSVKNAKISHIVFMGIGEPFDNFESVFKAISIINSPEGFDIGKRRITISTCGIIPGIAKLADMHLPIELSVSLHACDETMRSEIMPINKIYPLRELIPALGKYQKKTNRQITFEYILINGFNTDEACAFKLKKLLHRLDCKLNLINFNPAGRTARKAAQDSEALRFMEALKKAGIRATLRKPRGEDILAACGQLRAKALKTKEAKNE